MARGSQGEGGSAGGASAEHGADEERRDQAQAEVREEAEVSLEAASVDDLRKIAGDLGVVGRSEMRKPDLIDAIRRAQATLRASGSYDVNAPASMGHVVAVEDRIRQLEERVARLDNTVAAIRAGTTSPPEAP